MQGLGLALDESGWMMSVVLVMNHVSPTAQTGELDHSTVAILRMWQFIAQLEQVLVLAQSGGAVMDSVSHTRNAAMDIKGAVMEVMNSTAFPVQVGHSVAAIGSVSLPLVAVMEFKTALMAVMRLTAP